MLKIKTPVVFLQGLGVAVTDYYKVFTRLSEIAGRHCEKFIFDKMEPALNMDGRGSLVSGILSRLDSFHLVGNSRGGLDARYALYKTPGLVKKCKSITTVGTPHLGTPLADMYLKNPSDFSSYLVQKVLCIEPRYKEIVVELTSDYLDDFNLKVGFPEIPRFCLPFIIDKAWKVNALDKNSYAYMLANGFPETDGVVPLVSQLFGETIGEIPHGNIFINYGSHKSAMAPLRYGLFPWQTIWEKTFTQIFDNIRKLERS